MFYTIYKITNLVNDKIYIGAHGTDDLNDNYMGSGKIIYKAKKKYGINSFVKEIMFIFDNASEMFEKEREIVNDEFVKRKDNYNMKPGGTGNAPGYHSYYNNITETYEIAHKEDPRISSGILQNMTIGKTTVIKNGEYFSIDINEFKDDKNIFGVCKNKIPVFLKNSDECIQIDIEEYRNNKHLYTPSINKNGVVNVLDADGISRRVTKEEYQLDKSLTHVSKNIVTAKNTITGETVSISKEEFDSSEIYVGVTKGQYFSQYYYQIFNNDGILLYDNIYKLGKFVKDKNLPSVLIKSQMKNGEPIYQKLGSNESRLRDKNMLQYVGWYCIKLKKENSDN